MSGSIYFFAVIYFPVLFVISKNSSKMVRNFYPLFQLTYQIFNKEKERVRSAEELKITEKMKNKAAEYVKKKMKSYDKEYKRSPQPT